MAACRQSRAPRRGGWISTPASHMTASSFRWNRSPTTETFGIFVMSMDGTGARKPTLFLESKFALLYPEFSPDGHWMAYVSAESGLNELYVQAYPGGGEKTRVSTAGGWEPIWIGNGRELLYRTYTPPPQNDRLLMSAAVRSLSPL